MKLSTGFVLITLGLLSFSCASKLQGTNTSYKDEVKKSFITETPAIKKCYEQHPNFRQLDGKITIDFEITDTGLAKNVIVVDSATTIKDKKMGVCLADAVNATKFPAAPKDQVAEVRFPFYFKPENSPSK